MFWWGTYHVCSCVHTRDMVLKQLGHQNILFLITFKRKNAHTWRLKSDWLRLSTRLKLDKYFVTSTKIKNTLNKILLNFCSVTTRPKLPILVKATVTPGVLRISLIKIAMTIGTIDISSETLSHCASVPGPNSSFVASSVVTWVNGQVPVITLTTVAPVMIWVAVVPDTRYKNCATTS
jgi:hypothetical protein